MKYKYKVHDKVFMKKKSCVVQEHDDITNTTSVEIKEIDRGDDELPYRVEFINNGRTTDYWVEEREIKRLAKVVLVGGE